MVDPLPGTPLAIGGTAEIYPWSDGQVLKLFYSSFPAAVAAEEARIAAAVAAAGLPVPAVGALLEVAGRPGLLYARVDGPAMFELLPRQPWRTVRFAHLLAELHAAIHAMAAPAALPDLHTRLAAKIRQAPALPEPLRAAALAALADLPSGDRLCHGDFHPGNVLLTDTGPVIIDWMDATCGSPLADVARTAVIALGAAGSDQVPNAPLKAFTRFFTRRYLRRYFRLRPGGREELRRWLPVVAAARLSEQIPELEAWLLAQAAGVGR